MCDVVYDDVKARSSPFITMTTLRSFTSELILEIGGRACRFLPYTLQDKTGIGQLIPISSKLEVVAL